MGIWLCYGLDDLYCYSSSRFYKTKKNEVAVEKYKFIRF